MDRNRREGEIAINGAISRSVDRDLAKHCADRDRREGEFAISDRDRRRWCDRRRRLGLCLPLALSLSLSLRNSFEVKIGTEIHFRSQSLFFWVNGNQFPENSIFRTNQTPAFLEMIFTQNKHSLSTHKKSRIEFRCRRISSISLVLFFSFLVQSSKEKATNGLKNT